MAVNSHRNAKHGTRRRRKSKRGTASAGGLDYLLDAHLVSGARVLPTAYSRYAGYIGRVGALAVALGVGAAVATGQGLGLGVAHADTTGSEAPSDSSADAADNPASADPSTTPTNPSTKTNATPTPGVVG